MNALTESLIVCGVSFAGVLAGALLRHILPRHLLSDEARDVVRLGTALISTIAALVLGLLIASAKSSYEAQSGHMKTLTTDVILLDRLLEQYGPEAKLVRVHLRSVVGPMIERIWGDNGSRWVTQAPFEPSASAEGVYMELLALATQSETQRLLKGRAIEVASDLARSRLLLFEEASSSIPLPFLAVLVFWLAIIFASFSLFARLNPAMMVALFIFAVSASGAIFLILELSQPFTGLMQISSEPLRHALAPL